MVSFSSGNKVLIRKTSHQNRQTGGRICEHLAARLRNAGVRILTYNVHSCLGMDGQLLPTRIAEVITTTGADVVCLQELDVRRKRSGLVHQGEVIAEELAMHFHFFPAIRAESEEYGDAILSRYPMKLVR